MLNILNLAYQNYDAAAIPQYPTPQQPNDPYLQSEEAKKERLRNLQKNRFQPFDASASGMTQSMGQMSISTHQESQQNYANVPQDMIQKQASNSG